MMEIDSPHPQGIYCIISGHRNCFLEEPRKYLILIDYIEILSRIILWQLVIQNKFSYEFMNHLKEAFL